MTRRVLPRPRLTMLLLLLAGLVWGADQVSKEWALEAFRVGQAVPFIGEILQFTLVFNPGAAFSLGTGITPVLTAIMATVATAILVSSVAVQSRWWAVALGFLLGGALGNLTDRLFRPPSFGHGHVVDFLMLPNFPVFNVADSFITTAAAMIMIAALRDIPFGARTAAAHDGGGSDGSNGSDDDTDRQEAARG